MKQTDELAVLVQQGHKELIPELWEAVCRFTDTYAEKYYAIISAYGPAPGGVTEEDLKQCGFLAVMDAVSTFDSSRAGFITHLIWYLRRHFRAASIGVTERQRREPLKRCFSLDAPLTSEDPDGDTWLDTIPDSRDDLSQAEERLFQEQLRKALETALNSLPSREAEAIRAEYFYNRTKAETADILGVSQQYVHRLRNSGLHHIRYSSARAQLERFLDLETPFYRKVGVERFNNTHTSAVEDVMLWREKRRAELGKSYCSS